MKLLLLRHATAQDPGLSESDDKRDLTELGEKQALSLGRSLALRKSLPDIIFTSPYFRAVQTSKKLILGSKSDLRFEECSELSSGEDLFISSKRLFTSALDQGVNSIMMIGHQPDLGELVGKLLGSQIPIRISPCTLVVLEITSWRIGGGVLIEVWQGG